MGVPNNNNNNLPFLGRVLKKSEPFRRAATTPKQGVLNNEQVFFLAEEEGAHKQPRRYAKMNVVLCL